MGDTIFDILKLLEGLVVKSASEANVVTIGKNANIFIIGSEGCYYYLLITAYYYSSLTISSHLLISFTHLSIYTYISLVIR